MSDLKDKMHQNIFPLLGPCPIPRWGSLQRSPDLLAKFNGVFLKGEDAVSCMLNASGNNYRNSAFIVDVAMGQIPRSAERISR